MTRTALLLCLASSLACGDDDGTDASPLDAFVAEDASAAVDAGIDDTDFLTRGRMVWTAGCECLAEGADRTACLDDADKIAAQVAEQGDCVVTPFEDPDAADYVGCYESTTATLESCLEAADCDVTAVSACYDAWDPAIESCPQPPASVWEAVDACFD